MNRARFRKIRDKTVGGPTYPSGATKAEWDVIFNCAERWQAHVFCTLKDLMKVAAGDTHAQRRDAILALVATVGEIETVGNLEEPQEFIDEN